MDRAADDGIVGVGRLRSVMAGGMRRSAVLCASAARIRPAWAGPATAKQALASSASIVVAVPAITTTAGPRAAPAFGSAPPSGRHRYAASAVLHAAPPIRSARPAAHRGCRPAPRCAGGSLRRPRYITMRLGRRGSCTIRASKSGRRVGPAGASRCRPWRPYFRRVLPASRQSNMVGSGAAQRDFAGRSARCGCRRPAAPSLSTPRQMPTTAPKSLAMLTGTTWKAWRQPFRAECGETRATEASARSAVAEWRHSALL